MSFTEDYRWFSSFTEATPRLPEFWYVISFQNNFWKPSFSGERDGSLFYSQVINNNWTLGINKHGRVSARLPARYQASGVCSRVVIKEMSKHLDDWRIPVKENTATHLYIFCREKKWKYKGQLDCRLQRAGNLKTF